MSLSKAAAIASACRMAGEERCKDPKKRGAARVVTLEGASYVALPPGAEPSPEVTVVDEATYAGMEDVYGKGERRATVIARRVKVLLVEVNKFGEAVNPELVTVKSVRTAAFGK